MRSVAQHRVFYRVDLRFWRTMVFTHGNLCILMSPAGQIQLVRPLPAKPAVSWCSTAPAVVHNSEPGYQHASQWGH